MYASSSLFAGSIDTRFLICPRDFFLGSSKVNKTCFFALEICGCGITFGYVVSVQCVRGVYEKFSVLDSMNVKSVIAGMSALPPPQVPNTAADLWNHAGCHCLRHIDFAETVQSISCLPADGIPAQSTSPMTGAPVFCANSYSLAIFCMHFADGTAHHRRILAVYVYQAAVDHTVTSNYTIGWCLHAAMLKSQLLAVTCPPISTKLFSSSKEAILVLAKLCAVLLILQTSIFLFSLVKF